LLGRTLIFDNIDNASAAAVSLKYKVRMVTLDGQVINAGGSYTGGSAKNSSGVLSRSMEIDKMISIIQKRGFILSAVKPNSKQSIPIEEFLDEFWNYEKSPYV
jgi:chromosome segregation protein